MSKFKRIPIMVLAIMAIVQILAPALCLAGSKDYLFPSKIIKKTLNQVYFGNSLWQWALCLFVIFAAVLFRFIICSVVYNRIETWVSGKKTEEEAQVIIKIKKPLAYIILLWGIMLALRVLNLPKTPFDISTFVSSFFATLISLAFAWLCVRFVDIFTLYLRRRAEGTESKLDDQLVPLISKSLKIFIFIVVFAVIVQNLGYSLSGLLAGLGIGGLAFALAAKDTLANLFGSVTIFLDNPFQVGDWIKAGQFEGTVESIGFRSTKIRTFYKTEISVPNNKIANMEIDNFSRMQKRRISTTLGFTYETSAEKMEEAIEKIKIVLKETSGVYQEFFLVNFVDFGPSSLNIMLYYFTNTTNWQKYLEIRQEVNLGIMKAMQKINVEFAFNSMSIYMRSDGIPQDRNS